MWAAVARQSAPPPTPEERLNALAHFYKTKTPSAILLEALGAHRQPMVGTPEMAVPLVEHMVTICIDTESSTNNTDLMTELGLNTLSRKKGREVATTTGLGVHGEKLMEQLEFYHFRVVEHAHLLSNREGSLGPLGNRFGHTRFTTFKELRVILKHFFEQDIVSANPALKGCKRPVILVGHALRHDEENLKKTGLEYDFAASNTVVAKVDTQPLAREVGVWNPPPNMLTNEIGLRVLIEERLGFLHLDDHTACNDSARTMMCGIWMVLPATCRRDQPRTMQQVANHIERQSLNSPAPYGTAECCTRCGRRDHSKDCCTAAVSCAACDRFDDGPHRADNIHSHIETYCPHVARFKAWARRYRDAYAKNRATGKAFSVEVLAGPGADSHPFSTWRKPGRPFWPLEQLSEVLEGMAISVEPAAFVYNLRSAVGGLPVPSDDGWYKPVLSSADVSSASSTSSVANDKAPSSDDSESSSDGTAPSSDGKVATPKASPVHPTSVNSTAPPTYEARRVTKMSEQHGRSRNLCGRGHGRRSISGGRGRLDGRGRGKSTAPKWDAWKD